MVEKRIEREREREKSVLYKSSAGPSGGGGGAVRPDSYAPSSSPTLPTPDAAVLSEADAAQIETQLSPEQLQLFAEENDTMLRHYEDTLGKVQYVESSSPPLRPFIPMLTIQKRGEIPAGNLLPPRNPRHAPGHARRIHLPARQRRGHDADECRAREYGAQARDGAEEYGAGGVLGDGGVVYVACCLGLGFLMDRVLRIDVLVLGLRVFSCIACIIPGFLLLRFVFFMGCRSKSLVWYEIGQVGTSNNSLVLSVDLDGHCISGPTVWGIKTQRLKEPDRHIQPRETQLNNRVPAAGQTKMSHGQRCRLPRRSSPGYVC